MHSRLQKDQKYVYTTLLLSIGYTIHEYCLHIFVYIFISLFVVDYKNIVTVKETKLCIHDLNNLTLK